MPVPQNYRQDARSTKLQARCPFHKTFFPCSLFPVPCSLKF
ncbi:hypothetical protein [Moorena sp. SIO3I6]|nr:hypothetical protein [Moorena sp. SIO3I6]